MAHSSKLARFRGLVIGVTVAAVALTGCSTPSTPGDTEGVLRVGIGSEPETLDPHATRGNGGKYYSLNVFERLYEHDDEGALVPALATAYDVSESGDSITYTLREGVKFHDGSDFTADDVVFSFERWIDPELENGFAHLISKVSSVEAIDTYEVKINLSAWDGQFISAGGYVPIVPKAYIEANGNDGFAEAPIGTGPLAFVDREIRQSFTLERFDDYWGDKAGYETYEFSILSDANSRVAALRSGTVDLISQVPPQNLGQLESASNLEVKTVVSGENVFIKFNMSDDSKPWADARVREALDLAIDKQAIIDSVLVGLGQTFTGVAPVSSGYDLVDNAARAQDLDRARQLLADAGYADGFSIRLVGPVNGRMPASEQVVQAVVGFWTEIGVDATAEIREYSQWLEAIQANGDHDAGIGLHGDQNSYDPQERLTTHLVCGSSYSSVCIEEMDQLIEKVVTTVDENEREQAYVDAFRYVWDTNLQLFLYTAQEGFAMSSTTCWEPYLGSPFTQVASAAPCR